MKYNKLIVISSIVALIGYISSGPAGFLLVRLVKPQPSWQSSAVFAQHYHLIQDVPFYFGILLTGGMLMLVAAHYLNYEGGAHETKFYLLVAFGCTVAFFALISFNYITQTTFVRHLSLNYAPENDVSIATFSMANPKSLGWSLEIWGYGFLGIATWLISGYYENRDILIRALLIANAVVSVAAVVLIIIDMTWLLDPLGIIAYFLWNLLMIAVMILICLHAWKTRRYQ